ncbi:hypothetical protein Taro_033497 [Colocasia esculenta]|uniref:Pentatricopeptide repeat-containing protein n=1 Tax=Colocasia esculenta TaxID=4460 RepID=A0A843W4X3_COLES|nr:hypothetical protein [Colocasia esculenta]
MASSPPILSLLERCSGMRELRAIHAQAVVLGLVRYAYIASRILAFCAVSPRGSLQHARQLFDRIPQPTVFNWNTMIRGCSRSRRPEEGVLVYALMRRRGVGPNMHTFPFAVKACACLSRLAQVHGQVLKFGFDADVYVVSSLIKAYADYGSVDLARKAFDVSPNRNVVSWTSLITGYYSHGLVDRAREVFDQIPEKNDASWSAMISGYAQNERYEEAVEMFRAMRDYGCVKPNGPLLVSFLNACAGLGALEEGRWVQAYVDGEGLEYGLELGTALVNFYAKCGCLESALEVFHRMKKKDVTAWSAMIMGLALNGQSQSALKIFSKMLQCKVTPNAITFIGVLSACNHGGLLEEGREKFESMSKIYGISPTIEHYGCVVDLLARAGDVVEAVALIGRMPMEPDGAIWGSLLSGCMMHGYPMLGEEVGRHVIQLDPQHSGRYVGLANMYAAVGRWEGVAKVRRMMKERRVPVDSGWSSIEMAGVVHLFLVDDRRHPQLEEIYAMLHEMNKELDSSSCENIFDGGTSWW